MLVDAPPNVRFRVPRRSGWAYCFAHSPQPYQPSPKAPSGRPAHCPFRGLLGVHLRYGLHTRAATVFRDTLSEGFSHFVTSMTAPVASGWSSCRVGFSPTGKRRLYTAHRHSGHWLTVAHQPQFMSPRFKGGRLARVDCSRNIVTLPPKSLARAPCLARLRASSRDVSKMEQLSITVALSSIV